MVKYKLLKTIWYRYYIENNDGDLTLATNNVDILTNPFTECIYSINSMSKSPEENMESLGNKNCITYSGIRIPPNNFNSTVKSQFFNEKFYIFTPDGNLSGEHSYQDFASGSETTINKSTFTCTGGTGVFRDATFVQITYDNSGDIFGFPYSRRLRVFQVTND